MRKLNSIIAMMIMVMFLAHMIQGGMVLTGMVKGGHPVSRIFTHVMVLFVLVHMLLSGYLTVKTVQACKRSGVSYFRQNRLFWVRRISGFALMLFMVVHVFLFTAEITNGMFLLRYFDRFQLACSILLVLSLLVHLTCNITPLRIALGLRDKGNIRTDIILVLSILLLLAGIAFVVYYIRWMRI